ncbi:hypothetical protein Csa_010852 [Cucumis sativus]|uniref:Uncharacterized protein n=1 Tax=Cucumis sativus TaxID=3659 RepID=A0A0A0L313_CUCSA|nr:hypothetical protein Csa_010852 [Cucumis sativus]
MKKGGSSQVGAVAHNVIKGNKSIKLYPRYKLRQLLMPANKCQSFFFFFVYIYIPLIDKTNLDKPRVTIYSMRFPYFTTKISSSQSLSLSLKISLQYLQSQHGFFPLNLAELIGVSSNESFLRFFFFLFF